MCAAVAVASGHWALSWHWPSRSGATNAGRWNSSRAHSPVGYCSGSWLCSTTSRAFVGSKPPPPARLSSHPTTGINGDAGSNYGGKNFGDQTNGPA